MSKKAVITKSKKTKKRSGETLESYTRKITKALEKAEGKCVTKKMLEAKCKVNQGDPALFNSALRSLLKSGEVCSLKKGYGFSRDFGLATAEVVRLSGTFGFIRPEGDPENDIFVPGKFLLGAMPGDRVLYKNIPPRGDRPEGEVVDIIEEADSRVTGKIISDEYGTLCLLPDTMARTPIRINHRESTEYRLGDKVLAEICYRGRRHAEHKVKIVFSFGTSERASACAQAMIALHGVTEEFSAEALAEAAELADASVTAEEASHRLDLRDKVIFTIDSAYTKDIDDAVSIERTPKGYRLGVHIADVSHYVRPKTALDNDAISRGTSVYYADRVIPMLPKELSNGICSLNPKVDRLAFSALMELDELGEIVDFDFKKTVIRSRLKGVYKEINTILAGEETAEIREKYAEVADMLPVMNELCDVRMRERMKRGAPEIETAESALILNEEGVCVDVKVRERGKSECIIEEMMLLANEAAAKFAAKHDLANFVYRVHEKPSGEKIENLENVLNRLGIEMPDFSDIKPVHLAEILRRAKGTPEYPVLNSIVLRSMAKAAYDTEPIGHFGLALKDYTHFTSPIRRYPDLAIHRIMSDFCESGSARGNRRYKGFAVDAAKMSSEAEVRATMLERDCEDCYKAEYMQQHLGEELEGIVSGISFTGFYVQLPSSVEGMVHVRTLPEDGDWDNDEGITFKDMTGDKEYRLGMSVKVKCVKTDVNSGNIDFEVVE